MGWGRGKVGCGRDQQGYVVVEASALLRDSSERRKGKRAGSGLNRIHTNNNLYAEYFMTI